MKRVFLLLSMFAAISLSATNQINLHLVGCTSNEGNPTQYDAEKGAKIDVDTVLLVSDGDKISVGAPYVKGAKVQIVVEDSFRDKKVLVFKYKSKKDYHRLIGHRQNYTNVRVEDIVIA